MRRDPRAEGWLCLMPRAQRRAGRRAGRPAAAASHPPRVPRAAAAVADAGRPAPCPALPLRPPGASKTNEGLCENSMAILRLLSEEVFDFSKDSMTQVGRAGPGWAD